MRASLEPITGMAGLASLASWREGEAQSAYHSCTCPAVPAFQSLPILHPLPALFLPMPTFHPTHPHLEGLCLPQLFIRIYLVSLIISFTEGNNLVSFQASYN